MRVGGLGAELALGDEGPQGVVRYIGQQGRPSPVGQSKHKAVPLHGGTRAGSCAAAGFCRRVEVNQT